MSASDEVMHIEDPGSAHLVRTVNCYACAKAALDLKDMANFIVAFYMGADSAGEPIIRDGVFTEDGKLAILKTCPSCGPKIKMVAKKFCLRTIRDLPDGPLRRMLNEVWPRRRPGWKLEIGWQLLVPMMAGIMDNKIAQARMS